jgi:hypothetical protein
VTIHEASGAIRVLREGETLDAGDLLGGLLLPLVEIFA